MINYFVFSIVHIAVINEEETALKLISEMLKKISVLDMLDHQNKKSKTPLHLAARANQTDIIRILLRNGAKVDARARVSC